MNNIVFSTGEPLELGTCYSLVGLLNGEVFYRVNELLDSRPNRCSIEFLVENMVEVVNQKQHLHWHPYRNLKVLDKMFIHRECQTCPNLLPCTLNGKSDSSTVMAPG